MPFPRPSGELDAAGMLVMPGAIDVHTHMEMPFMGTSTADDFLTGTRAAAAGGVTCLIDFAIQPPQTSLLKTLEIWKQKAAGKATIDYSFHLALTHWDDTIPQQVKTLIELGFPSLKVFMAYKGALMLEDAGLLQLLQTSRELGALVMVHAENGDAIFTLQQQALARNETSPRYHALTPASHRRRRGDCARYCPSRNRWCPTLRRPRLLPGGDGRHRCSPSPEGANLR